MKGSELLGVEAVRTWAAYTQTRALCPEANLDLVQCFSNCSRQALVEYEVHLLIYLLYFGEKKEMKGDRKSRVLLRLNVVLWKFVS